MQLRYKILAVIWFFQMALNFDRVAIAFAGPAILKALSMGPQSLGTILSAFAFGYLIGQIPGGLLADRWRVKTILIALPLLWAFFTGLTALMATMAGFVFVRACLGLAEGLAVPACFRVIGESFDPKARTGAMALSSTASALGPAFAGPIIGLVMASYGWSAAFWVLTIPPVLAAVLIFAVLPKRPSIAMTGQEPDAPRQGELKTPSMWSLLSSRSLWACVAAFFFFNIAYWGYNGWMPSYLAAARHIDLKHLGLLGGIPYILAFVGLLTFGWLGTVLHRWRAQLLAVSYVLAGLSLYFAFASPSLNGAMVGLCGSSFFLSGGIPLFSSLLFELAPKNGSGSYAGIVFTAGQIGGVIAPFTVGYLVQASGSYGSGFAFMEIAMFAAALAIVLLPIIARLKAGALEPRPSIVL